MGYLSHSASDYLQDAARYSHRGWKQGSKWSRRGARAVQKNTSTPMTLGLMSLLLTLWVGYSYGPDIVRYLRIRSM